MSNQQDLNDDDVTILYLRNVKNNHDFPFRFLETVR